MTGRRAADGLLILSAAMALFGLAYHHMAILGDGFWTLASGEWMLAHHAVPHTDPFAYGGVSPWTLVSPGACVVFALVNRALGLPGLMVFGAVVEAAAVLTLWVFAAKTRHARLLLLPLALLFIEVDAEDLSCRGQLFGDLGFVLLLGMLARLRDRERVHPALVVALAAAWTNLHLSFLAAVFVPLLAATVLLLDPERPRTAPFAAVAGLASLGTLVNPYGLGYLRIALGTAFDRSTGALDLFQSPNFHDPAWLLPPATALVLVASRNHLGPDRLRRPEQAFVLVFAAAACMSRRYATELVAVEVGIAGVMLDSVTPRWPRALTAGVAAVSALAMAGGIAWMLERHDPERDVPVAAAAVARDASRALREAAAPMSRVVDPLHWGGYLAYAWMGDPRYWIDGRDHLFLFGNGAFDDHAALRRGDAASMDLLDTYEAGVVLWERGMPLDAILAARPDWQLVHADPIAVVYVRRPRAAPR